MDGSLAIPATRQPTNEAEAASVAPSRVIAVIVTYNRMALLRQCVDAVLGQTRPPDAVVVVNNGSDDGTADMLDTEYAGAIVRVQMRRNVGGAGGFYRGIVWAYDDGADWLWLMDDDGIPAQDGLEVMLRPDYSARLALMNPLVVSLDDPTDLSFGVMVNGIATKSVPLIRSELRGADVLAGQINPFNGTLVSREVVRKVGLPKREMFIWGDEVDYTNRVQRAGFPFGTILSSTHRHPGGSNALVKSVRFGFLGSVDLTPDSRIGLAARNMGYLYRTRGDLRLLLLKPVVISAFHLYRGKFRNFWNFIRYYADGVTDRFRLEPSREALLSDGELFEVHVLVQSRAMAHGDG